MKEPSLSTINGINRITMNHPVLSLNNLSLLLALLEQLAHCKPIRPLVLHSNHPSIFLGGAHLKEIAALNASSCIAYARYGRLVIATLEKHPAPTVAAVHGACAGGGLDLVLAFDSIVYDKNASFAHPGVKRGLVTGWGGTSSLPSAISRPVARNVFTEGSELSSRALNGPGFLFSQGDRHLMTLAIEEAQRLERLNHARITLWRSLKSGHFIDRFRASMVLNE